MGDDVIKILANQIAFSCGFWSRGTEGINRGKKPNTKS